MDNYPFMNCSLEDLEQYIKSMEALIGVIKFASTSPDKVDLGTFGSPKSCDSPRCIWGWYVTLGGLPIEFLKEVEHINDPLIMKSFPFITDPGRIVLLMGPDYLSKAIFGLTNYDWDRIFGPHAALPIDDHRQILQLELYNRVMYATNLLNLMIERRNNLYRTGESGD